MSTSLRSCALLLALALPAGTAQAATIASMPFRLQPGEISSTGSANIYTQALYRLEIGGLVFGPPFGIVLFEFAFDESHLGQTLLASATNMPTFAAAAALLTNASLTDRVRAVDGIAGGPSGSFVKPEEEIPLDLSGQTLLGAGLRIDSVSIDSPGSDPNGDGVWTDVEFVATVFFYDTDPLSVPEPGAALLAVPLALLARRLRR